MEKIAIVRKNKEHFISLYILLYFSEYIRKELKYDKKVEDIDLTETSRETYDAFIYFLENNGELPYIRCDIW